MRIRNVVLMGVGGLCVLAFANRAMAGETVAPDKGVDPKGEPQTPTAPWVDEIRKKLSRKVSFEFIDTPIQEALIFLQSLSNVNMVLDPRIVEGA